MRLIPAAAVLLAGLAGWHIYLQSRPITVRLHFVPIVGGQPLALNQLLYSNPGGEGLFKIRDFQFYLSNIRLLAATGEYTEPASYHLVRFDSEDNAYTIVLNQVPRANYSGIQFALGVDARANGSIESIGDLDANGRMAWNWEVGYKFILFEGGLQNGDLVSPLVYHIGFDENYRELAYELEPRALDGPVNELQFQVDIMTLFSGKHLVDMQRLANVKFDRTDAKLLADNYANMVSYCGSEDSRC